MATKPEQGIGNGSAVISLRFFIASILVAAAAATGISILSAENPVTLFAEAAASLADKSGPQPTGQSTPIIQSVVIQPSADAEALLPTAQDVPTREINAPEPTSQTNKKENDEASLEALFREFQTWNAEQDARDLAKPVQDHPAPVPKNASASVRPVQKHRRAQTIRNARAEMIRDVRERRPNVRRQNEQVQARPVRDARAQARPVRDTRAQARPVRDARAQARPVRDARAQTQPVRDARAQARPVQNARAQTQYVQYVQPPVQNPFRASLPLY
jgi:hypothetical protein